MNSAARQGISRHGPAADAPVSLPTSLVCSGCGYRVPGDRPIILACPNARRGGAVNASGGTAESIDDDVDHVLERRIDTGRVAFPNGSEANPFVRYRVLFHAYHVARGLGWSDADYVALVERLDRAVADADGHGFRVMPFTRSASLGRQLGFAPGGGVLIKDETGNVSGSHKARHLMGTLLELEVAEAVASGGAPGTAGPAARSPLAIASCGNAALAAAVVASAAGRPLDVYIPVQADPEIAARLRELGARITVCERDPEVRGDPTYHRLLDAINGGALAFGCQGNLNGLAIEGGATLGYEMVSQLREAGGRLDRVFVQVGGGALASAVAQAFLEARLFGAIDRIPRIHAVQTRGGYPLVRAWDLVVERIRVRVGGRLSDLPGSGAMDRPLDIADPAVVDELSYAAHHRSAFMWPWETEPQSVATGILDDETYDWLAVVKAMLATGGGPIVVDETTLIEANQLARSATGIDVDPTGSSGLAGLIDLVRRGDVHRGETVAVLFTGITRGSDGGGLDERVRLSAGPGETAG